MCIGKREEGNWEKETYRQRGQTEKQVRVARA